jgi:hypothetical protein
MAILAFDGFDHYNQKADWLSRSNNFIQYQQPATNANQVTFVTGRNGFGKAMELSPGASSDIWTFGQRVANCFIGFAGRFPSQGNGVTLYLMDSTLNLCNLTVVFNPLNYSIQLWTGPNKSLFNQVGTLVYSSPNNIWSGQVWNFFEIWANISGSGFFKAYVNGVLLASFTGNTRGPAQSTSPFAQPNLWWDQVGFQLTNVGGSSLMQVDDLYYGDTTVGPGVHACDQPIGDVRVATLFPIGNNTVQWTPLSGTNWQMVDEVAMDSDTTYNSTSTAGNEDLLNFQSLPSTVTTIYALQVTGAYRKDDALSRTIKQAVKSGVTEAYGANYSIPDTSYAYFTDLFTLNPNTSANWTLSDVNGMSAGYNLVG